MHKFQLEVGQSHTHESPGQTSLSDLGITNSCARQNIGPNMLGGINIGGAVTAYCYDNNGNQINAGLGSGSERVLTYAVHDKPLTIRTAGSNTSYTAYTYGTGREIVSRKEGANIANLDRLTHYVGGMEVTYRPDSGALTERREFRRYLSNFLVITMNVERNNGAVVKSSTRRYRFEEKLGSLDVLTDAAGTVVQRMSFDVWGQRRSDTWGVWSTAQVASFDNKETRKGYTGHEMLDASNLIHMGGRMYDPMVGKFLSADILVQAPFNSQSHNRYSYVMNNPMNYTDPSGYAWIDSNWRTVASIAINFFLPGSGLVGAANGLLAKVITGMISGAVQTGSLKGALTGGFGAAMFHGIGQKFSDMAELNAGKEGLVGGTASYAGKGGLTGGQFAAKIAAHATAGGVMSVLNGGKFGHGFASAGLVEAVNPALAGMSEPSMIAASIVVGGTSSVIAGGKFANGAVTASFQLAFNHMEHSNGEQAEMKDGGDISGDEKALYEFEITASTGEGHKVGHSYIGVRLLNGSAFNGKQWIYFGFWPESADWYLPSSRGVPLFGSEETPIDSTYTKYYSVRYQISQSQYSNFRKYNNSIEQSNKSYHLYGYNCSSYALRAAQSVGINVPLNMNSTPNAIRDWITNEF